MQKSCISFYFASCAISMIFNTFYPPMKDYTTLLFLSRYVDDPGIYGEIKEIALEQVKLLATIHPALR